MEAPQGFQTARFYVDTDIDTRPEIIKRLTKSRNYKSSMEAQLSIEDRVMQNGHSPDYYFTKLNHFEIIDMFEKYRIKHNLTENEFAKLSGYSRSCYMQKVKGQHRFSKSSLHKFWHVCDKLEKGEIDKWHIPSQQVHDKMVDYTEQKCIEFLKATGKYKISKSEITTNWIEL
jgi:hypothetical protein